MRRTLFKSVLHSAIAVFCFWVAIGNAWAGKQHEDNPNPEDQVIVDKFYPPELVAAAEASDPGEPFDRKTCSARLDPDSIIAGYSNGFTGAILLLKAKDGQYSKVFQTSGLDLGGLECSVALYDLLGDGGGSQAIVSFYSMQGNSGDWVFRRTGDALINIGATKTGFEGILETELSNTDALHLDRNSHMQLVTGGEYPPPVDGSLPPDSGRMYDYKDGSYKLNPEVTILIAADLKAHPNRKAKKPLTIHFQNALDTVGPYTLRLLNGDSSGAHRVSNGKIFLNSNLVASVKSEDNILTTDVSIGSENALTFDSDGAEQGGITIVVEGHTRAATQ